MNGWPTYKRDLSASPIPFFNFRDELTVQDGMILRGNRVVITTSLRTQMKNKVHAGHMGINSCPHRARDLIYWPGMSSDIRQFIETCDTCATLCDKQSTEPLCVYDHDRPWEKVGTELFHTEGRNYLIT